MTDAITRADAINVRATQVREAEHRILVEGEGVPYPWHDLDQLAAPIQEGEVDMIAADSGMGKSTLVTSAIERWLDMGVQVVVNCSEIPAKIMRSHLAMLRLGIYPAPILSGEMKRGLEEQVKREVENGANIHEAWERIFAPYNAIKRDVAAEIRQMEDAGLWENLHVVDADFADARALQHQGDLAKALEKPSAPVMNVVDHIDHLPDGDLLRESKKSLNTVKNHAKSNGTRWLLTSQLNRSGAVGGDLLWRHRPVQEPWISSGKHKTMICWRVFGAFRPLKPEVTSDELKAVREGRADVSTVVWDGVTCLNTIKHRHFGSRVGKRVLLSWEYGKVIDAIPSVRAALESKEHGIRTDMSLPPTRRNDV